jgi:pimeloyl-ACP methyl ester carboxylesterase
MGTLLFDLLSPAEERRARLGASLGFPIPLLGERVQRGLDWLTQQPTLAGLLPVGLFGASTGAAAALQAAASRPHQIAAIVSRGGRPDLAGEALAKVLAPTLLIVGSLDPDVLALNRSAGEQLRCPHRLAVVEGAGHLFEQAGSLAQVGALSCDWFLRWLRPGAASLTTEAPVPGMALLSGVGAWR